MSRGVVFAETFGLLLLVMLAGWIVVIAWGALILVSLIVALNRA